MLLNYIRLLWFVSYSCLLLSFASAVIIVVIVRHYYVIIFLPHFPLICYLFQFYRERDSDRDGKVNFKEFFHGLFDLVRNYDEEAHNSSHESDDTLEAPAKKLFTQLDKDGDGW